MTILWIGQTALQQLETLAAQTFPRETGGILVGYVADSGEIVVQEIIGSGPKATHERYRFAPDHGWQCQQLDALYERSGGVSVYLGDWHTHPNGHPKMSWMDKRTLARIAASAPARCPNPVMLIGGGAELEWSWGCYRYVYPRFLGVSCAVEEVSTRIY